MSIQNKRTWTQCGDKDVLKIFNEVVAEAKRLYPHTFDGCEPELFINSSTHSLGRCVTEFTKTYYSKTDLNRDANANKIRYRRGVILLSQYILHDKDKVCDVLCHELGHYVAPAENHNYLWRIRANNIGKRWGITNTRLDNSNVLENGCKMAGIKKAPIKYVVECPKCGSRWNYKRMCATVQYPEKYRCVKCHCNLVRIK